MRRMIPIALLLAAFAVLALLAREREPNRIPNVAGTCYMNGDRGALVPH
jgi:hypothetical protein